MLTGLYSLRMKTGACILVGFLGGALLGPSAWAIANDATNPYLRIVDRNPFGLREPLPPAPETNAPAPPPFQVELTGITTILGDKRALFLVTEPATPGQQPKPPQSYILREGQQEGPLEVVSIDENTGLVKILNAGVPDTLDINKRKLPSGGGTAAPGGAPAVPGGPKPIAAVPLPLPSATQANPTPAAPSLTTLGGKGVSVGGASGSPAATTLGGRGVSVGGGGISLTTPGAGTTTLPSRTLRLPGASVGGVPPPGSPASPPPPSPPIEEQILMIELQREANRNNPNFPPLPPTALTPNPESLMAPPVPPAPQ